MNVSTVSNMPLSMLGAHAAQDVIESAARLVDSFLSSDASYSDLSDLLQVPKHTQPSVSGLHDHDYPCLATSQPCLAALPEVSAVKKVPLPAELVEQFGHMQLNSMMGLFPEITRAWLSIDSDIFVWNYEDGGDLAYFDGLNEAILSVGLVKPKTGIFQPHILYLLCLATATDIVLLGVSFSRTHEAPSGDVSSGEMHLLPEPLFSLPTDNTHFLSITGADNGRIFMASKDGCLYELVYQAEDGWFSRKCHKINHSRSTLSFLMPSFLNFSFADDDPLVQISIDDSRHILYTRSEKGSIQVYDLGEDGKGMSRVAAISLQTTVQNAALVGRNIDRSKLQPLVHIAAIPASESANVHLVAITHSGVRLYYTTSSFHMHRGRPSMLSLVHVRLPPGFSANAAPQRPNNVRIAHHKRGTLLLVSSVSEENDLLWTIGPDTFPFQKILIETYANTAIDSKAWALAEVPVPRVSSHNPDMSHTGLQRADPPLVVTQHMEPVRRFVLLTAQGSHLLHTLHPVDQLRELLLRCNGPDAEEVKAFFRLHKEDQACATCLILACSKHAVDKHISEWARRAFFLYGGEAEYNFGLGHTQGMTATNVGPASPGLTNYGVSSPGNVSSLGPTAQFNLTTPGPGLQPYHMSTPYSAAMTPHHYSIQQQQQQSFSSPMSTSMSHPLAPPRGQHEVNFSGKHNGLCLYLVRILRPIWESRVVVDVTQTSKQGRTQYLASSQQSEQLSWFLEQLLMLRDFITQNSQFASPALAESLSQSFGMTTPRIMGMRSDGAQMDDNIRKQLTAESQAQEKASLQAVQQLIGRTCETLALWKTLCDHQFHVVAAALAPEQQNQLRGMNFKMLVVNGAEICNALIQCLISRYLDDNATTDAISSRLREVCGSMYSHEDAVCSKANEMLQSAKVMQNKFEKEKILKEALQLYKQITSQLDLPVVCSQFAAVRFYEGIVDLSLTAANKLDPQGIALHYYKNGEPAEDKQGTQAFISRMDCYKCITEMLHFLLTTSVAHPQAPSVPKSPGPPPTPDPHRLTNAEAEQYTEQVLRLALKSEDEMFHVALYEWLVNMHLTEKLLEIQSPYLEPYLKRTAGFQPENLATLDLLWKYYEKTRNYSAASRILAKLADRHGTDITLQQRIEYLSRAAMSAKSSTLRTSLATEGEFLHELEEKMEVARIQLQIYETLNRLDRGTHPHVDESLARLNSELMDITALYGEFADVYDLSECKLAIIHCAGHYDPTLVESLWLDIIKKELQHSRSLPASSQMSALSSKLTVLGRMYAASDRYFPLPFLVKQLELLSCRLSWDAVFVFRTLQDVGITLSRLHEIYDRLFKSKDTCWEVENRPFHILTVISRLMSGFTETPSVVPAYERRQFVTTCLDCIAGYLVELQAMSSTDNQVNLLTSEFKGVQARLERLL